MTTPEGSSEKLTNNVISGVGAMATAVAVAKMAYGAGSDTIKVGLLGCGGRGTGAVRQCLQADPGVVVIALADLFESQVRKERDGLMKDKKLADRVKVADDHLFWGFDCHEKLAQCEADLLLMATAPAFRGRQMLAAVKAGKHIFTEKPVATDVAGCREVMEAARIAKEKGLAIVAGTQRRHEFSRVELMKRIHDGAIGELVGGQCYWYGAGIWYRADDKVKPGMSELEWQCHNWYHFSWLSGDQITEQHIHNIDVMNWCFGGPPARIMAGGGRGVRDYSKQAKDVCKRYNNGSENGWEKYNGNIWDHIFAEFEYPNGARCLSFSGHGPGTGRSGEKLVGTKGASDCRISYSDHKGKKLWTFDGKNVNGQQQEHVDLIRSIRAGKPLNDGQRIAETTLTAVGARIAAYTGHTVTWDWLMKSSKEELVPRQENMKPGPGLFLPIATGSGQLV